MTTTKKIIIGGALVAAAVGVYVMTRTDYNKLLFSRTWYDGNREIPADLLRTVVVSVSKDGLVQHKDGITGQFTDKNTIVWSDGVSVWTAA